MSVQIDRASRKAIVKIERLAEIAEAGVEYGAYRAGKDLVNATSREILKRPKGGRVYVRRDRAGRRRRHVASAPGETHANRTGTLRRSLSFAVGSNELEFGYGVTKNDAPNYAEFVEFGTKNMAERPSLQNGINSMERNIEINIQNEIGKRLNK